VQKTKIKRNKDGGNGAKKSEGDGQSSFGKRAMFFDGMMAVLVKISEVVEEINGGGGKGEDEDTAKDDKKLS
jgi:hypothetical protein